MHAKNFRNYKTKYTTLMVYVCCTYYGELMCSIRQWLYACTVSTGVQPSNGKRYRAQANEIFLVTGRLSCTQRHVNKASTSMLSKKSANEIRVSQLSLPSGQALGMHPPLRHPEHPQSHPPRVMQDWGLNQTASLRLKAEGRTNTGLDWGLNQTASLRLKAEGRTNTGLDWGLNQTASLQLKAEGRTDNPRTLCGCAWFVRSMLTQTTCFQ